VILPSEDAGVRYRLLDIIGIADTIHIRPHSASPFRALYSHPSFKRAIIDLKVDSESMADAGTSKCLVVLIGLGEV
jgi:hypothetical protein